MKILGTFFFIFFLQGCWWTNPVDSMPWNLTPLTALGVVEATSYITTDKFVGDHVSSMITGKDCSIERKLSGEGKYCMTEFELFEAEHSRYNVRKVYCYRSLASSTCYYEPSPNKTDVLIGVYDKPIY